MSHDKNTIVLVFGATGSQGGSVVRALLAENTDFLVRAVTRDASSEKAKALAALDPARVEVVEADNNKPESLPAVFEGAQAAFLLTNFWDPTTTSELESGKLLADQAKAAGVKHVVWSGLADVEKESSGKWNVPHFTIKALVFEYIESLGFESAINFAPSFYYQNFEGMMAPKADEQTGVLTFTFPDIGDARIAMFDVEQSGLVVAKALLEPKAYNGRYIGATGDSVKLQDLPAIFDAAFPGRKHAVNLVPIEVFATFPFPGAEEIAHMFGWFRDHGYHGKNDGQAGGKLATLSTLKEYLQSTRY